MLYFFLSALSREEREQRDLEQLPKIRRQSSETAMSSKDISRAMQDDDKLAVTIYYHLVQFNCLRLIFF